METLGLLQQLPEYLVDVESVFGRSLDVPIFPVKGHCGLQALAGNLRVGVKVVLVGNHNYRNLKGLHAYQYTIQNLNINMTFKKQQKS